MIAAVGELQTTENRHPDTNFFFAFYEQKRLKRRGKKEKWELNLYFRHDINSGLTPLDNQGLQI